MVTKPSGALSRVGGAVAMIILGLTSTASWAQAAAQSGAGCVILQVYNRTVFDSSTVVRIELPDGRTTQLGERGYQLNAIGYSRTQDRVYGMAERYRGLPFNDTRVVTIDRQGEVADLGPLRPTGAHRPPLAVLGASAGAIAGNRWYVRRGTELYTVDVDPGSPSYLGILRVTSLRSLSLAVGLGDFDFDPADGLLYGVSASLGGSGEIVAIDPGTGSMRVVPGFRLPASTTFGAVVIGSDRALYVTANQTGGRSLLYRVERRGGGSVTRVSSGPAVVSSDAAGCLVTPGAPPAPGPAPPVPPPVPAPPSATVSPSHPPGVAPPAEAPLVPPTTSVPVSATPSPPVPGVLPRAKPKEETPEAVASGNRTEVKRRWALALLLVLLGAGAAAHRSRRGR